MLDDMRNRLAKWLRARVTHVDVRDAMKAIRPTGADPRLEPFDFVVYPQDRAEPALLILCVTTITEADRDRMAQWQTLFGSDYRAVFAVEESMAFEAMDGEPVVIADDSFMATLRRRGFAQGALFALLLLVGCESAPSSSGPFEPPTYINEIYRSPIGTGSVFSVEQ
jgi:hypothetical protein